MNILVTAIGSMSSECVIGSFVDQGFGVVGTDIYPKAYHPISKKCRAFVQVPCVYPDPLVYCNAILEVARQNDCAAIIPLTDPEVDVLSANREIFENAGVSIWFTKPEAILKARAKESWNKELADCTAFKTIPTYFSFAELTAHYIGDFVAKRINGRSSEGICFSNTSTFIETKPYHSGYIFQPKIGDDDIVTVDFAVHPKTHRTIVVPRREILRTKNGAGTVVEVLSPTLVQSAVEELTSKLGITGVMNCEFIQSGADLYLMDINPRFSAGVAFSKLAGYDFAKADSACYLSDDLPDCPAIETNRILVKRFVDFYGL